MNIRKLRSHRQGSRPILPKGKLAHQRAITALFIEGAAMAGADPVGVCRILSDHGIGAVCVGGIVVGCHSGRPRATQDVTVIIDTLKPNAAVLRQLSKLVKATTMERHPSFLSFLKPTATGEREVLDVITSKAGSYGLVFDHCQELTVDDVIVRIPTVEMMLVLKYTAAVSPIRGKAKQLQDWSDLFAMIDANPDLSTYTAGNLADLVVPGWGEDLSRKITEHRK